MGFLVDSSKFHRGTTRVVVVFPSPTADVGSRLGLFGSSYSEMPVASSGSLHSTGRPFSFVLCASSSFAVAV